MQRGAPQVRDGGLKCIGTIVQGQQRVAPERDDHRLFRLAQHRRRWCFRTRRQIFNRCPLSPFRHRLRVTPKLSSAFDRPSGVLSLASHALSWRFHDELIP